ARLLVNQEDLLHAKDQAVHKNNFGKRLAGAEAFHAPLQSLQRKTVLERFVERCEHLAERFGNRLANRRPHHRKQRVGETLRIVTHRLPEGYFNRRGQRFGKGVGPAALLAKVDGFRDDGADVLRALFGIVQTALEGCEPALFGADQEIAQFVEVALAIGGNVQRASRFGAGFGLFRHTGWSEVCSQVPKSPSTGKKASRPGYSSGSSNSFFNRRETSLK